MLSKQEREKYLVFRYGQKSDKDKEQEEKIIFNKQATAIQHMKNTSTSGALVFAYEISETARRFLVCDLNKFLTVYEEHAVKNFYEVLVEGQPVKLFLDCEFYKSLNSDKNGDLMTEEITRLIESRLMAEFNLNSSKETIVLESCNSSKYSVHVIWKHIVFSNLEESGFFVKNVLSSMTTAQKRIFEVNGQHGRVLNFVDSDVYTKNRHLRLFLSSKYGQDRILRLKGNESVHLGEGEQKTILLESLVSNTAGFEGQILKVSRPKLEDRNKNQPAFAQHDTSNAPVENVPDKNQVSTLMPAPAATWNKKEVPIHSSDFRIVEEKINEIIKPSGGRISNIIIDSAKKTLRYEIKGNQYCRTKEAKHRSSKIFFKYFIKYNKLIQDCHSPRCYNKDFGVKEILFN